MELTSIIILILVLVILGVGGYFGWSKLYQPMACKKKEATSNIATFTWSNGECIANTCVNGYSFNSSNTCISIQDRQYNSPASNTCVTESEGKYVPAKTITDCKSACDASSTCTGYQWSSGTPTVCTIYSEPITLGPPLTMDTCNILKT